MDPNTWKKKKTTDSYDFFEKVYKDSNSQAENRSTCC